MKKSLLILIAFVFGVINSEGRSLSAFFSYCTFNQPGKGPYIETYLNVAGHSTVLKKNAENKFQGKIEVQWVYKQGDKIVHFDKYNLLSPAVEDTVKPVPDFVDQQRVMLPNGEYTVELKITDKGSFDQGFVSTQSFSINYPTDKVAISDIELVESYTQASGQGTFIKNGYEMIPLANNYFPKTVQSLKFYAEIYNAKEVLGDGDFLVSYYISGYQNNVINNLISHKKQKASSVNILMAELPIQDIMSGNYFLAVEIKDKANRLLDVKKVLFQRSKPSEKIAGIDELSTIKIENTFVMNITDKDTLVDYISSLYPISAQFEANVEENQVRLRNMQSMQQFFLYFWTNHNPQNPEQGWLDYKAEVDKANASFKSLNKKGYETDRGRVYLQYGQPNEIYKRYSEPGAYPYEIWHYNTIANQSDGKFVFYAHNLTSNDFELLHSNVNGEFQNENWTLNLASQPRTLMYNTKDVNGTNKQDNLDDFGSRAREEFDHPK
jgi:GWxTD domain-containing protein